jgi:hypothetical protein
MPKRLPSDADADLASLRQEISGLVARNAVSMVQQAIDAVHEEGQYQAIRFLFEMIGLYPAAANEESPAEDSLARLLLERLGLPSQYTNENDAARPCTRMRPVK